MGRWIRKDGQNFFIIPSNVQTLPDGVTFKVPEKDYAAPEEVRGNLVRVTVEIVGVK